jgi:hypothetical protein
MKVVVNENSFMIPEVWEVVGGGSHPLVSCTCRLCGTKKDVDAWALKSGAVRSCGCLRSLVPNKDITGLVTDSGVTVLGYIGNSIWRVQYTCSHLSDVPSHLIHQNKTGLCDRCSKSKTCTDRNTSHGMSGTPAYKSWLSMKRRCYSPSNNRYEFYGGKGIVVCDRWLESFENFYEDMGDCPAGMSIDRIDTAGNYEPSNCKWSTVIEQANNKTSNLLFTDGEQVWSLRRWCDIFGKDYKHVWYKYRTCGLPVELLFDGKIKPVA